jgi:hypothetical protein
LSILPGLVIEKLLWRKPSKSSFGESYRKAPLEKARAIIAQVSTTKDKTEEGWVRRELAYLKVNVDTSSMKDGQTGAGAVIRDHGGLIVCSAWNFIPHCQSVAFGEPIACHGLKITLAISSSNLLLETACVSVMEPFQKQSMDKSEPGHQQRNIKLSRTS